MEKKPVFSGAGSAIRDSRPWASRTPGPRAGLFWVVNRRRPPQVVGAPGRVRPGGLFWGRALSAWGRWPGARCEASLPPSVFTSHPTLPHSGGVCRRSLQSRASFSLPLPPNSHLLIPVPVTNTREDKIAPQNIAIKRSVSSASYQGCLIKEMVPRPGYPITK